MRIPSIAWLMLGAFLPLLAGAHGSYHEQLALWEKAQAQQPLNPMLWVQRAALDLEHEDWAAALVALEKASRLGAEDRVMVLTRAKALAAGRQWQPARNAFDEAIAVHGPSALVLRQRARVLVCLRETEAALADYRAALDHTTKPEPELLLEAATAMVASAKTDEALHLLDQGIQSLGPVPSLHLKALDIEMQNHQWDAALRRLEGLQSQPRPELWMARRASVLAQAGRVRESAAAWRRLREHLLALPEAERGSHAMSQCLTQTNQALAALAGVAGHEGGLRP